jgi:hypothetical protein
MKKIRHSNRRSFLVSGTSVVAALSVGSAQPGIAAVRKIEGANSTGPYLDLKTPYGNLEGYARLRTNVDMKSTHYGWYDGLVIGVAPGEALRNICGARGVMCSRLLPLEGEHGYRRVQREVIYYYDLETGEVLDEMLNPYTGETVKVVHVANDPFNRVIRETAMSRPTFGGLNQETERPAEKPILYKWTDKGDRLTLERHIHLYYRNALDPKKWVRESSGPMNRASEFFQYNVSLDDMQNKELTTVDYVGYWGRVTPWLPWMLMGQAPGHCLYQCQTASAQSLDDVPSEIIDYTAKHFPKYLEAPTTWEEPSLSSLERYALEQEPILP